VNALEEKFQENKKTF